MVKYITSVGKVIEGLQEDHDNLQAVMVIGLDKQGQGIFRATTEADLATFIYLLEAMSFKLLLEANLREDD